MEFEEFERDNKKFNFFFRNENDEEFIIDKKEIEAFNFLKTII